jgi:hypothetical protein
MPPLHGDSAAKKKERYMRPDIEEVINETRHLMQDSLQTPDPLGAAYAANEATVGLLIALLREVVALREDLAKK